MINIPLWCKMLTVEEIVHVGDGGVYGNSPDEGRGDRGIKNPGQVPLKKQQHYLEVYKYSNNIFSK